jgi:hypothetical protein
VFSYQRGLLTRCEWDISSQFKLYRMGLHRLRIQVRLWTVLEVHCMRTLWRTAVLYGDWNINCSFEVENVIRNCLEVVKYFAIQTFVFPCVMRNVCHSTETVRRIVCMTHLLWCTCGFPACLIWQFWRWKLTVILKEAFSSSVLCGLMFTYLDCFRKIIFCDFMSQLNLVILHFRPFVT